MSNLQRLDIIYEDDDIILCRKPAGVATQTKRLGQQDMESLLRNYRAKKKEPTYIGVVHRLDQPVEGIMVFAKNQEAAASLSKQIQQKIIGKHYYAISANAPAQKEGKLEDYLVTDKKTNVTRVVKLDSGISKANGEIDKANARGIGKNKLPENAKKAILEYKLIGERDGLYLFDIHLHTGRQHQIRVQMAHMGCPLLGDSKYGDGSSDKKLEADSKLIAGNEEVGPVVLGSDRLGLALCSYRLAFTHPTTKKRMDFSIKPRGGAFACVVR